MLMGYIWTGMAAISLAAAWCTGQGGALSAAIPAGAQAGVALAISIAGSICLWSAVGRLMEASGMMTGLSRLLRPILHRVFPSSRTNKTAAGYLSANICANFLGLGNAATPMGIRAVGRMVRRPGEATDEMCRLIVLNTASIQLIPATVAAVRGNLGSARPFDILPAVWITSLCSAGLGLAAAYILGKVWRDD